MSDITVRFVPHAATGATSELFSDAPAETMSQSINPNKTNLNRTMKSLNERALRGTPTALNRVTVNMTMAEMSEMFGEVDMTEEQTATGDGKRSITLNETYQKPKKPLQVPDALQNSVAFAYVPRPPEYFAPNPIPPMEHIYHLRLAGVQMALNVGRCHRNGWTGRGVRVAMADSGFFLHPWFLRQGAQLIPTQSPGSGAADVDTSGHGTGEAANIFAVAPDCTVFGVKSGSSSAATLETCIDQNPDVMTNSWGFDIDTQSRAQLQANDPMMFFELVDIENVLNTAINQGITVCFSAGNGHLAFPASHPDVIAVGGVTVNENGTIEASSYASAFTSQLYPGREVPNFCGVVGRSEPEPMTAHIMLPVPPTSALDGENFPSGNSGTGWGIFSGTSASSPQVAGLVALLKQINPNLSPAQVQQVIAARCVDVETGRTATGVNAAIGPDPATGAGLVDALRACGFAAPMS